MFCIGTKRTVIKASPEIQSDKASMGRVHFPFLYFFKSVENPKFQIFFSFYFETFSNVRYV